MSKGTTRRSIRVGDLWDKAQQVANQRGGNLSDIIREALRQYVENHTKGERMNIPDEEAMQMPNIDKAASGVLLLMAAAWEAGWSAGAGWPQEETNPYRAVVQSGEYTDQAGQKWVRFNSDSQGWVYDDNAGGVWVIQAETIAAKISNETQ